MIILSNIYAGLSSVGCGFMRGGLWAVSLRCGLLTDCSAGRCSVGVALVKMLIIFGVYGEGLACYATYCAGGACETLLNSAEAFIIVNYGSVFLVAGVGCE